MSAPAPRLAFIHQSLSTKVFNLLKVGHHIKSLLRINYKKCKWVRISQEFLFFLKYKMS